jgi:hypothetical protein
MVIKGFYFRYPCEDIKFVKIKTSGNTLIYSQFWLSCLGPLVLQNKIVKEAGKPKGQNKIVKGAGKPKGQNKIANFGYG